MRKLVWTVAGFGISCCIGIILGFPVSYYLILPFLGLLVTGLYLRKHKFFAKSRFLFAGMFFGLLWISLFQLIYIKPLTNLDQVTCQLSVTASEYGEKTRYSESVYGYTGINGVPYRIRLYIKESTGIEPGDIVEGEFRLRLTTAQGKKSSVYYQGDGVYLTASQNGECKISKVSSTPLWCIPAVAAKQLKTSITKIFPEDAAAFAKALLLGDTSELSYAQDTALKVSGIRHVVAVSGLHVSVIFAILLFLFRWNRFLSFAVSIPVLLFFSAATGFSPSVIRASLMAVIMLLGNMLYEEYDGLTGLAAASGIMMLVNPYVVESVSFQLSVASVTGILIFAGRIMQWLQLKLRSNQHNGFRRYLRNWIAGSASVSLSAQMITVPFSAFYFGAVSLIGIITNLLTIWIIMPMFCGIALAASIGIYYPAVGSVLAAVITIFIRFVLFTANLLSKVPYAAVYTQSIFVLIWLVFCYILLVIAMKHRHVFVCSLLGIVSLITAILLSTVIPRNDDFRATILDVGEGQCILLQSKGESFLVDCGGDNAAQSANITAQTLASQGIDRLVGITFTHFDSDHTCATENILSRVRTDKIYSPAVDDKGFIQNLSESTDCEMIAVKTTTTIPIGSGKITLYSPGNTQNDNENCMCVLFETENCAILITGDRSFTGEKNLIKTEQLPDVNILVGGHHGSRTSTSIELLEAVNPEVVVFSVGAANTYGHPAEEVLTRVADYGCTIYRTDLDGSVLFRR